MTKNKRRWYLALYAIGTGGAFFGYLCLSGEPLEVAGLSTIIWLAWMSLVCLVIFRRRRKSIARTSAQGQVSRFIRRPAAPAGNRFRKWKSVLIAPDIGALTIHPTLGGTLIARGTPFTLKVHPSAGPRLPATKWEKFNRFGTNTIVLPLETSEGPLEIAGQENSLDTIESSLAGTKPSHNTPEQP
ncbi:hypothetical protein [Arthrobacter sp. ERGS1:01]|uniref:hypothetical protein n=1 Tax=Arthrobacter sp. ERGS1:01 TaxID=1704044 RepID=UPI0012377030|nr:hypothetical protein [Arthrobacter sp. ERGS1:01]